MLKSFLLIIFLFSSVNFAFAKRYVPPPSPRACSEVERTIYSLTKQIKSKKTSSKSTYPALEEKLDKEELRGLKRLRNKCKKLEKNDPDMFYI